MKCCECGCGTIVTNRFVHNHHGVKLKYTVTETGCWQWLLSTFKDTGYGKLEVGGKTLHAHRYYYELHKGKIPHGLVLDHLCRNITCVNPNHLEAVSHVENVRRRANTKLTPNQVAEIKTLYSTSDLFQKDIAKMFGVQQSQISRIVTETRWKDAT